MKPTEKFFETIEASDPPAVDPVIGSEPLDRHGSIMADRLLILGRIKAIFDWAYERSGLSDQRT